MSAGKFHIGANGQPAPCRARTRPCPLGGEHFDSREEAYRAIEKTMSEKYSALPECQPPQWADMKQTDWQTVDKNTEDVRRAIREDLTKEEAADLGDLAGNYRTGILEIARADTHQNGGDFSFEQLKEVTSAPPKGYKTYDGGPDRIRAEAYQCFARGNELARKPHSEAYLKYADQITSGKFPTPSALLSIRNEARDSTEDYERFSEEPSFDRPPKPIDRKIMSKEW